MTHPPLTIEQAAERLNQSHGSIYTLCRTGRFPNAYKIGAGNRTSPIRIPVADIERYEKTQPRAHAD